MTLSDVNRLLVEIACLARRTSLVCSVDVLRVRSLELAYLAARVFSLGRDSGVKVTGCATKSVTRS